MCEQNRVILVIQIILKLVDAARRAKTNAENFHWWTINEEKLMRDVSHRVDEGLGEVSKIFPKRHSPTLSRLCNWLAGSSFSDS